jgi:CRP/FNR family transcriptional regulator
MCAAKTPEGKDSVLSAVPYFAGLPTETLEDIRRSVIRRRYRAGEFVLFEAEPSKGLYIVERGWLKAVKTSTEGREQVLQVVGPGEIFGAVGVFVGEENPATVVALENSQVCLLERERMLDLLGRHPDLAEAVIHNLAQRVLHLVKLVEDLSLRTVVARLARLLIAQGDQGVLHRRRWTTQAEMAARLGTVPDVLNRALRDLAGRGLVEVERHQIRILDREALEEIAMTEG